MFTTLARRAVESPIPLRIRNAARASAPGIYGRFKPKKVWPPDFSKLSEKEQFRFERKYKRRVKLATMRPRWDKYVKLAQLFSVTGVLVYSLLFMEGNTEEQPFQGIRSRFWGALDAFSPNKRNERRALE
ncbi:hypothetical protein PG994_001677 [Apiospora phragmitis]|uniref:Uncharacterized protein n=1 Tax=Apiospora phragmitis TaxID=2905665 RepID=A0ABR1WU51_9PEZI